MSEKNFTSLFNFNADIKLPFLKRIYWLIINFVNNLFPEINLDTKLIIKKFNLKKTNKLMENIDKFSSPARIFCDNFWFFFPWEKIHLNKNKLNFVEIGCGKGVYANLLSRLLQNNFLTYKGIDIKKYDEWKNFNKETFDFNIDTSDNVTKYIENCDILFTQSAIEHFENDLLFFKKINNFLDSKNANLLQIHLFPSCECLGTYLWHGYRQYSPRNISKITKLFNEKYTKILFKLGSSNSNTIHKKFITYPKIFKKIDDRYSKNSSYIKKILNSFEKYDDKRFQTSFYALVIFDKEYFNLDLSDF